MTIMPFQKRKIAWFSVHLRLPMAGQISVLKSLVYPCTLKHCNETPWLQSYVYCNLPWLQSYGLISNVRFKVCQFRLICLRLRVNSAFELILPLVPLQWIALILSQFPFGRSVFFVACYRICQFNNCVEGCSCGKNFWRRIVFICFWCKRFW